MPQHFYGTIALTQACSSGSQEPSIVLDYRQGPPLHQLAPPLAFQNKNYSLPPRDPRPSDLLSTCGAAHKTQSACLPMDQTLLSFHFLLASTLMRWISIEGRQGRRQTQYTCRQRGRVGPLQKLTLSSTQYRKKFKPLHNLQNDHTSLYTCT